MLILAGLMATSLLNAPIVSIEPRSYLVQDCIFERNLASIDYENSDVREVLKTIFKEFNINYSLHSNVQGKITLHMRNVSFENALKAVVTLVGAEYRLENQAYVIEKKRKLGA